MAGHTDDGHSRAEHVLTCMKVLGPNIREEVVAMWDSVIPKLLSYLTGELCGAVSPVWLPMVTNGYHGLPFINRTQQVRWQLGPEALGGPHVEGMFVPMGAHLSQSSRCSALGVLVLIAHH